MCLAKRANRQTRRPRASPTARPGAARRRSKAVQFTFSFRLLAPAVAIVAAATASAGSAQVGKLAACLAIPEIDERVACYDAIARTEQSPQSDIRPTPEAPSTSHSVDPTASSGPTPRAEFGFSAAERDQRRPVEQQPLEQLAVRVSLARVVGPGYWQFTMDDGSIWQLAEVRRAFRPPNSGDATVIRRGSLGSYFLDVDGQPGMRIKRLK